MGDPRQTYRELDAPLTKYLLGFGRSLAGLPALPVDWDWSLSWDQNLVAGAYPSPRLLQTARRTITLLLPLTALLIYAIGNHLKGRRMGWIAAFLFAVNPVVLLHGRRAMAEGPLLLAITLAIWSLIKARRYPWLTGLALALAFNAKQSSLFLLPVGVIAAVWIPGAKFPSRPTLLKNLFQLTAVFFLVTLALNPLYWRHPLQTAQSALAARSALMQQQASATDQIAPEKAMQAIPQRIFVLFLNLYISPPEYGLVANLAPTQPQLDSYLAIPGHNLFRGIPWGSIFFVLTLYALYRAMRNSITRPSPSQPLIYLILASLFTTAGLVAFLQIYWIRYSIPLTPFISLWIAYALSSLPFPSFHKSKSSPSPPQ